MGVSIGKAVNLEIKICSLAHFAFLTDVWSAGLESAESILTLRPCV